MKIIFLNAWRGGLKDKITSYLINETKDTEVFCIQESNGQMGLVIEEVMGEYQISSINKNIVGDEKLSITNFFKDTVEIVKSESIIENREDLGIGLFSQIKTKNGLINIGNVHGLPSPGKLDTKERIEQSEQVIMFFENYEGKKIIGGDFNVLPDQKSITMFEENGYIDLIKKYKIKTTRNEHAWKKYPNNILYYSDYLFVSPDVKIKSFEVLDIEVSDHLPLVLEIED